MPNWSEILNEINVLQAQASANAFQAQAQAQVQNPMAAVRHKYMSQLHGMTGRNVIAYYSGWLSKTNSAAMMLTDEDKNGFMACVHKLQCDKGLDLILHTPGGSLSATQSLVHYLGKKFGDDIRAIVPQIAMSAGTMLACSCKSIVMGKQSNLGPIDPQLYGVPAHTVIEEFDQVREKVVNEKGEVDPVKLTLWHQIIGQYRPTFLTQCGHAIERSNQFVKDQLEAVMFKDADDRAKKANKVVQALTRHQDGHEKHYHLDECQKMGLKIEILEKNQNLQDAVLSVHHAFMHTLMNTPTMKIIENHMGAGMAKNMPPSVQG